MKRSADRENYKTDCRRVAPRGVERPVRKAICEECHKCIDDVCKGLEKQWVCALVRSCAAEVAKDLGFGHTEAVYQNALAVELRFRVPHAVVSTEVTQPVYFRGVFVGFCRADIVVQARGCYCVIELKQTQAATDGAHKRWCAQVAKYTRVFPATLCMLVIFGASSCDAIAAPGSALSGTAAA